MAILTKYPEPLIFGLDIGTRSIVGTVGFKENDKFNIIAQAVKFHDTRAMLDGQIHDIAKVGEEIREVKASLEAQLDGRKLTEVCIAAAGRVLKTAVGHGTYDFPENTVVNQEYVHSLDLIGVEKAHEIMVEENGTDIKFFCVGYSVIKYYLNDFEIMNLEGHKAKTIAADVLATFLPEEVVDGLYAAVKMANLEVANLTLEPIAAINVAIPEEYRLLNIGLLDVGAGTSDICITKDGSIIGYGMIPSAGDEITEVLIKKYLVDFKTAEKIKQIGKKKTISFKDIMGINHKITKEEVYDTVAKVVDDITKSIADKIIALNGGKPISALFVVGGGGKLPGFTDCLAKHLKLPIERVGLRGEEVLQDVDIHVEGVKKDPLLVTPIGICLNFYDQKNNFIFVQVNGERVKLYNNNKLTIFDAAVHYGMPNENIFPKRGKDITFKINGKTRIIRGYKGEAAEIALNGEVVGMNTPIEANDKITIKESTAGEDAVIVLSELPEFKASLTFWVNDVEVVCPSFATVNNKPETGYYQIQNEDDVVILNYYTLEQLLTFMDVKPETDIYVNNMPADFNTHIYENFKVQFQLADEHTATIEKEEPVQEKAVQEKEETKVVEPKKETKTMQVIVNQKQVTLTGKNEYVFVDIFDFYPFDTNTIGGSRLVMTLNGEPAQHFSPLFQGAVIELYWEK